MKGAARRCIHRASLSSEQTSPAASPTRLVSIDQPVMGDQICVASVTVTRPDQPDQQRRAWTGGNGAACEAVWDPSAIIVDDNNHETRCVWAYSAVGEDEEVQGTVPWIWI